MKNIKEENQLKLKISEHYHDLSCFNLELEQVSNSYSNTSYMLWAVTNELPEGKILIPSKCQRFKRSPGISEAPDGGVLSTWNEDDMAKTLTSWITRQADPSMFINVIEWNEHGIALLYDGESKLHFYQQFLDNKNVFKVMDGKNFSPSIEAFLGKSDAYRDRCGREISVMFNRFKEDDTTGNYMTLDWMTKNGFTPLIDRLKHHKAQIGLKLLAPSPEADTYEMLASTAAKHETSQLAMTHLLACDFYSDLYFNFSNTPKDKMTAILKGAFDNNVIKYHVLNSLFTQSKNGVNYQMLDVYLFNLLVLLFTDIEDGKLEYSLNIHLKDHLRLLTRYSLSEDGAKLFKRRAQAYTRLSKSEKKQLINKLIKVVDTLANLFAHIGTKKTQNRFNPEAVASAYAKINKDFAKRWVTKVVDLVRARVNIRKDEIGIILMLFYATKAVMSNAALTAADAIRVFDKILIVFEDSWVKYVFSKQTLPIYDRDWSEKGKQSWNVLKKNQMVDNKGKLVDLKAKIKFIKPTSVGEMISTLNSNAEFGMEVVAKTMIDFFDQKVEPTLEETFGEYDTSTHCRIDLENAMSLDDFHKDNAWFIDPHGNIYSYYVMDISHLDLKSGEKGNGLTGLNFIPEYRPNNQGKYKYKSKNRDRFYALSMTRLKEAFAQANEMTDLDKMAERMEQLINVKKTMEFFLKYQEVEVDSFEQWSADKFDEYSYLAD